MDTIELNHEGMQGVKTGSIVSRREFCLRLAMAWRGRLCLQMPGPVKTLKRRWMTERSTV